MEQHATQTTTNNPELDWIAEARSHIGLRENVGSKHNPIIVQWVKDLGGWWKDDETPWCGVFVAHCLQKFDLKYPKHWYRALAYDDETLATKLDKPAYGCVAVKKRKGGGHVCFVVGRDEKTGKLQCLGGNQGNAVSISLYDESAFDAFLWYGRTSAPAPHRFELNMLAGNYKRASSEA